MPDQPDTLYTRTLRALQDTTACPACTGALRAGRCAACGLDVSGPDGAIVWQDSQAVVRALSARQARVAAMRAAQTAAARAATHHAQQTTAHAPGAVGAPGPHLPPVHVAATAAAEGRRPPARPRPAPSSVAPPSVHTSPATPAAAPRPSAPAPARRPWRVQTVLQVVGAALLVAASITFLVFAWDVMGLRGRAAVVGVGTLVVFALASWLRARRLPQGAEAVGAVAVVLLLLDAWAVRATGVVSVGDGTAQAGVSVLVCAAVLTAWGVRSRLRVGTVAGAALVPLAPLAWLPTFPHAAGTSALLLVAGTLTAVRAASPWSGGRAERTVLRVTAAAVLPPGVLTAAALAVVRLGDGPWSAVALLAAAVVVLGLQVAVEARTIELAGRARSQWSARGATVARAAWATAGGVTAVLTVAAALTELTAARSSVLTTSQAAVVGVCLAGGGLLLLPRRAPWDADLRAATRAALVVAAAGACWAALVVVTWTGARLSLPPPAGPVADPGTAAVGALLATGALAVLVVRRTGGRTARVAGGAGRWVVVLVAVVVPVLTAAGPVADLVLVVGEAVVVVGLLVAERRTRLGLAAARTGAVVAVLLAVLGAAPHAGWTAAALLLGAVLAVVARSWSTARATAPASTVVSAALLLAAGAAAGTATGLPTTTALALALAPVGAALLVRARTQTTPHDAGAERDAALCALVLALAAAWPAACSALGPAGSPGPGAVAVLVVAAPLVAASVALALVVALLRWGREWGAGTRAGSGQHVALGAGALAPVTALTVGTANVALGVPDAAGSALLVTMVGAVTAVCAPLLRSPGDTARHSAEATGALVVGVGVAVAAGTGAGTAAVALLLAAVGTGAWACTPGRSRGWWLALALATSAWWVLLGSHDASAVEPYTLPPALALSVVGAWRVARRRAGAPVLLGAGLALVTLPTAVLPAVLQLGSRWVDRGLVAAGSAVAVVGAALLLARRRRAAAEILAGLGAVLLVLGPLARAATTAWGPGAASTGPVLPDGTVLVEAWSWPAVAALVACAAVVRTRRVRDVLDTVTPWVLLAAAAGPTLLAVLAAPTTASAGVRATALSGVAVTLALVGGATGRRTSMPGAGARQDAGSGAPAGVGLAGIGLALVAAATVGATAVASPSPADALGTAQDLPVLAAGLVTLAVVALTARRGDVPRVWCAAGLLALLPSLTVRGGDLRLVLWGATAAVLLALAVVARGARRTSTPRRSPGEVPSQGGRTAGHLSHLPAADVARVLTGSALGVVVVGPWAAALVAGAAPGVASPARVELVAVLAALVALRHVRTWRPGSPGPTSRLTVAALLVLPPVLAVDASVLGTARGLLVLVGGGAFAWWARDRVGTWIGLGVATLATIALALRGGPEPADVPWTVLGLLALGIGARRLTGDPAGRSWPALGLPLALTLGAPLAGLVAAPAGWRIATSLVLGVVAVVAGAVRRWQAPLLLGACAVLATLVVVLSPLAAGALAAVDGWILLAVGGALVLGLGVTYERRVQQAREAVRFVREMR